MSKIGLATVLAEVRKEILQSVVESDSRVRFPINQITLTFHIGVTSSSTASGAVDVWVLEVGGGAGYERESIQTVEIVLGSPTNDEGAGLKIASRSDDLPG